MEKLKHDGYALGRIHASDNHKKYFCHFTGFLEGVAASGYFEAGEIEPLVAECEAFVARISDADADDIVQDFKADLLSHDTIASCAASRAEDIDLTCQKSTLNRFFGFCRGVACDGKIKLSEAKRIIEVIDDSPSLNDAIGVRQIRFSCEEAVRDGIVDISESNDICRAISEIVGDSYGDTGIASVFKVATFPETYIDNLDDELIDRSVVLTGTFSVFSRAQLESILEARGAVVSRTVSRSTHFIFVGGEASRDWLEMNRGTKIRKALELREKSTMPFFISESQLRRLMG